MLTYAIVGAGFSGAVLARELVTHLDCRVLVFDERPHVAGNCHTERDAGTGVMVHKYGPHIFHTSDAEVWEYVNRFGTFGPFVNRVKASTTRGVFSMPINLHTINQCCGGKLLPDSRGGSQSRCEKYLRHVEAHHGQHAGTVREES